MSLNPSWRPFGYGSGVINQWEEVGGRLNLCVGDLSLHGFRVLSKNVSNLFSSAVVEQERMSASMFRVVSRRGGSFCFPLIAFFLTSFQR